MDSWARSSPQPDKETKEENSGFEAFYQWSFSFLDFSVLYPPATSIVPNLRRCFSRRVLSCTGAPSGAVTFEALSRPSSAHSTTNSTVALSRGCVCRLVNQEALLYPCISWFSWAVGCRLVNQEALLYPCPSVFLFLGIFRAVRWGWGVDGGLGKMLRRGW
ncbi:hypothetical protein Salat_0653500 [Sesamum alatum]|uniref:Uncharacterized protein n=1 Tax=Sesamum alatum TaxID=300844 RepID=A0AAE1YRI4_9LAMI|nr:hypothetical protein Salat_0653500 [Sesamum alatum]